MRHPNGNRRCKLVSKSSPIPLYCQIKASLERDIGSGKLSPGAKMPSELELAATHKVSRTTARQALQKLCEAGLVVRFQGKGTFVRNMAAAEPVRDDTPIPGNGNGSAAATGASDATPVFRPQQSLRIVTYRDGEDICFDRTQQILVRGIERQARGRGYDLVLSSHMEGDDDLSTLIENRSDAGFLLCGEFSARFDAALSRAGIPAVAVDCSAGRGAVDCVLVDHEAAARLATQHLLDRGHESILYLGASRMRGTGQVEEWSVSRLRRKGFIAAMKDAGCEITPETAIVEFATQRHAYKSALRFFDRIQRPTAVVTFSPSQALGVEAAAAKAGLNIPGDLSLICFSDLEQVCFRGDMTFTAVWADTFAMGRQAFRLLCDRIENPARAPQTVKVAAQFWAGDTCAAPALVASGSRGR